MAGGVGAGRLAGKVAVITGASSGIGRAGAIRFAAEGARVVVSSNREDEGKRVVREIEEQGGTAVFVFCDVTRPDDVEALIATAERTWGAVHVLYASAGVMITGTAPETSEDDWRLGIRVNCLCPGPIETPMLRDWFNAADDPAEAERVQVTPVPLGRIGLPDEIADAALHLASDASSYATGSVTVVDGGATAWYGL